MRRVLVLAPHTDDGEFGAGGTIARWLGEGDEVHYAAFSLCEESVPEGWPADILEREVKQATTLLGIPKSCLHLFGFRVRRFDHSRQEILEELVKMNRDLQPDVVLCPAPTDIHQDHAVVAAEAIRAFKRTTILGYEMPWNNLTLNTSCFVKLQPEHVDQKVEALKCYESQRHRNYAREQLIRSLAVVRGTQIGVEQAETFEVIRWVM
ncbi:MAG: PIG-L family deacetylase [Pirellulales bacterium]|nr:PIG-L family deacetylase [Pirellulales bacterium]